MSDTVISVENLSKLYKIGGPTERYSTLRDSLARFAKSPFRRFSAAPTQDLWALKDVSFEVKQGDRIGIIGGNGAGKSTLLKLLSRITEPTEGRVRIKGRVASLLEVGTGFHPELTGRENIFLNGAILGMTKQDIKSKFDEIVDFAEIEKFLDTPVKRYSSGMYVRLAFSVAAHLEPDILLVDEVLAVGDVQFQKKCLGKMGSVAKEGRTVVFVSHNMGAVTNLCRRALLIKGGEIVEDATAQEVVFRYLNHDGNDKPVVSEDQIEPIVEGVIKHPPNIRLKEISCHDLAGYPKVLFFSDEDIVISVVFQCYKRVDDLRVLLYIVDDTNVPVIATQNIDDANIIQKWHWLEPGLHKADCILPKNLFGGRRFSISVHLIYPKIEHLIANKVLQFEVRFKGYNNVQYGSNEHVFLRPLLRWGLKSISSGTKSSCQGGETINIESDHERQGSDA
jgi:lipopolysaccharide transport system ATP-binding protein